MDLLKAVVSVSNADEKSKKYIVHETKYAALATVLLLIFLIPWSGALIRNTFPMAKGPLLWIYKGLFCFILYFIIQKTAWFQNL
jgi:hypothetical protein